MDLDLAKYFDTVNHDLLIRMIREQIKDEAVNKLIRKFLKSGVMANGIVNLTEEGTHKEVIYLHCLATSISQDLTEC